MKRFYFALAALAAIFAGCSKEVDTPEPVVSAEKAVTLKASIGDPATRVSSDNAGIFKWQSTDEITVVTNSDAIRQFTIGQITDGTSAEFSGTIPEGDEISYALYPASQNHKAIGNQITFHLDETVVWKADASNMPMLATVEEEETSFDAVGGVLKLILFNIPADADYLKFSATSKKITGDFEIGNNVITTEAKSNSDNDNELVINFSENYNSSKVFYIPLPTGTIDGFTVALYETLDANPLFSVTSPKNLAVVANHLIIAKALNCAKETILWSEDFSQYSADDVPGSVSGESYHGATGYTCVDGNSDTKIYDAALAGGTKPELLINKSGGSFTASGIPTNGAASMTLSFKVNNTISVSATSGITVGSVATGSGTKTVTLTNKNNLTFFDLTFSNSSSSNVRIDDISVVIPGAAFSVPSITADDEELTIAVSEDLSASTGVTLANAVDGLGISYKITYPDKNEWINSVVINNGTLTVTANAANTSAAAYTATVTLMASGATAKTITVTQESALVPNPTNLAALAGNATVDITWTGNANATSYVAYLHTEETETPATGGTNISSSITHDGQAYIIDDYTNVVNNQTYYVYVKVNGVAENYVAPTSYVVTTFTPAEAKGTAENPYLASELYDLVNGYDSGKGPSGTVYVKGYVSTAYNPNNNNYFQTYFISDDGTTSTQFQAYRGKGIGGADITNNNRVYVGDWVVVSGTAINYNGDTPEFSAGSIIITHIPKLATPTFDPEAGTYYSAQSVAISATNSATIYYTTDGTEPTTNSTPYSEPIAVSTDMTIKAIAVKENYLNSTVAEAVYVIKAPTKLGTPVITVDSFTHNSITFKWAAIEHASGYKVSTDGGENWSDTQAELTYTWSGLNASSSYTIYVKAIGTANGQYTDSDAASGAGTTSATSNTATTKLTNGNIVAAGNSADGYNNYSFTDENNNSGYTAYAIKNKHSNATSSYHYLQIKKYASNTAYYIGIPQLGTKITSIKMTVSSTSQPMTGGGNSATLYFSNSNSTSATGTGVASGTGSSSVTIDCSSLNLNTGYITASAGVRIWDVEITYIPSTGGGSAPANTNIAPVADKNWTLQ